MHLTLHTDYALRLLMMLAMEPDELHTNAEVSRRHKISRSHMMKVALTLVEAGFINSVRGRNGGLRLAEAAEKITLGNVIRATEDNFNLVECFNSKSNTCLIAQVCGLRGPLAEAVEAFLNVLDNYTLQDMMTSPGAFAGMTQMLSKLTTPAKKN